MQPSPEIGTNKQTKRKKKKEKSRKWEKVTCGMDESVCGGGGGGGGGGVEVSLTFEQFGE